MPLQIPKQALQIQSRRVVRSLRHSGRGAGQRHDLLEAHADDLVSHDAEGTRLGRPILADCGALRKARLLQVVSGRAGGSRPPPAICLQLWPGRRGGARAGRPLPYRLPPGNVRTPPKSSSAARVSEAAGDGAKIDAGSEQRGGHEVAEVVQSHVVQPKAVTNAAELQADEIRSAGNGTVGLVGEDEGVNGESGATGEGPLGKYYLIGFWSLYGF